MDAVGASAEREEVGADDDGDADGAAGGGDGEFTLARAEGRAGGVEEVARQRDSEVARGGRLLNAVGSHDRDGELRDVSNAKEERVGCDVERQSSCGCVAGAVGGGVSGGLRRGVAGGIAGTIAGCIAGAVHDLIAVGVVGAGALRKAEQEESTFGTESVQHLQHHASLTRRGKDNGKKTPRGPSTCSLPKPS